MTDDRCGTVNQRLRWLLSSGVTIEPWNESHAGNFDEDAEAYTLFIDGKRTNISFELEETEIPSEGITSATVRFPAYVADHGVEIEERILDDARRRRCIPMNNPDATVTVELGTGSTVVWLDKEGNHQAGTISEIDGDFVRVGGLTNSHWLRRDDILAYGLYGDEDAFREDKLEIVIDDAE